MSTIFYAVQCCQCPTMQVKQRKQYSKNNKWACVVCNQKQSARKVFAESTMARDLRPFVQSSNMSRQFTQDQQQQPGHEHSVVSDVDECHTRKKRRSDWTEYLDAEADHCTQINQGHDERKCSFLWVSFVEPYKLAKLLMCVCDAGNGFEPQVVTEFPSELFKKAKMNKCYDDSGSGDKENGGVYEARSRGPVISKRNSIEHVLSPTDAEDWKFKLAMTKNTSHWSLDSKESSPLQVKKATHTGASKWSDYVIEDDNDSANNRADNAEQWSNETIANYEYETVIDERVEDDIHPDFLQS